MFSCSPLAWQLSYGGEEAKVFVFNEWRKLSFQCWLVKNGGKSHKSHLTIFLLSPPASASTLLRVKHMEAAKSRERGGGGKWKELELLFLFKRALVGWKIYEFSTEEERVFSKERERESLRNLFSCIRRFHCSLLSAPHIECRYRMETLSLRGTRERKKTNVIKLITGKMCLRHISSILELFAHPSR